MTRKKSNVKALALAVTCAILAGGGIGLKPVYAIAALYKENSTSNITADATGATGNIADATKWKLTVIDSGLKIGGIDLGLTKEGAITAKSLTLADNYNVKTNIEDAKNRITTVDGNVTTNKNNITTLTGRVDAHDTNIDELQKKTNGITRGTDDSTTVDGVNFKNGAVSGVKTINNKIEISTDGKTVIFNKDVENGQVQISESGIKVGTGSTYVSGDAVYTGGVDYANAKAGMKNDGSLKATGFAVDGLTGNTTVDGALTVAGEATFAKETTFGNGIKTDTISEKTPNAGVTVDGNLHANKNAFVKGMLTVDGNIEGKAALKGKTLGIGGAGNEFTVDEDGNTTVGGTLGVTGKTTLSDELQVDKKATFGNGTGLQTVIEGGNITAGGMLNSESAKIGHVGIDNTGAITGVTSLTTDALTVTGAFTTGNLTVNGDLTASGAINGKTISINDSGSIAGVNFENGGKLTATTGTIGDVSFATGGNVSGITELTATTIKDGAGTIITGGNVESKTAKIGAIKIENETIEGSYANGLSIEGVKIKDGVVSDVTSLTANSATIGGVNTLDNNGLTVKTGSKVQVGTNTVIEDGSVKVSQKTSLTDQSLQLNDTNKWTQEGGLVADKATVNGVVLGDAKGKATFTDDEGYTTIAGKNITTGKIIADELLIDRISLGKNGNNNISIDDSGNVTTKGEITITDATNAVMSKLSQDKATFGKDEANQTVIENGKLKAKAKNNEEQQAGLNFDENGFAVNGQTAGGKTSAFGFNTKTGIGTFKGLDQTTTTINGNVITSTKATGDTGVLNGSNLTLTNGANSTALTAGGATFTGAAGEKGGKVTTINGGMITTDTLNVERINLGGEVIDKGAAGVETNSKLYMDAQGNFRAAEGNFTVKGGTGTDRGALHNKVGNTSFDTTETGASMKYNNGTVESNVSVGDNSAKISAGASSIEVKNDGITNNGVTTFNGTTGTTKIDGGTITTNHLITDKLTITGSGNADGTGSTTGSIAFGGNGSITSNIKDGTKEATFKTDETGTFTEAKDSAGNKTTNTVNAQGNTNVVTDGTNTSTATQTATSIGGVVTNGTVTMRQELTAEGVKVTDELGDPAYYTQITNKDVSITDQKNPGKRINLSDLGQLNDLDGELTARDEYTNNKTAVGAINAEAAIRREEVARLDGRINDVNDRVNKVGAMAAAIASLKSIGYDPQAPSEFSIGLGQYKGETGVAMGFFHYPNKNFMINVSLSTAGGETMGGIGATWRFGHKSPQKLLEEQREAQAKKELAAAEKYQAAAKLAKEAQERAEYAAKLARQAQVSADNAKAAADATQAKHFG